MKKLLTALFLLLNVLVIPLPALAQTIAPGCEGVQFSLGVPLPGQPSSVPRNENAFRCYVIYFYRYAIGLAVILAAIVITWAGYVYLTSGGDPTKVTHARELIIGALSGLALLLLAATVLRYIGIGPASSPGPGICPNPTPGGPPVPC